MIKAVAAGGVIVIIIVVSFFYVIHHLFCYVQSLSWLCKIDHLFYNKLDSIVSCCLILMPILVVCKDKILRACLNSG